MYTVTIPRAVRKQIAVLPPAVGHRVLADIQARDMFRQMTERITAMQAQLVRITEGIQLELTRTPQRVAIELQRVPVYQALAASVTAGALQAIHYEPHLSFTGLYWFTVTFDEATARVATTGYNRRFRYALFRCNQTYCRCSSPCSYPTSRTSAWRLLKRTTRAFG